MLAALLASAAPVVKLEEERRQCEKIRERVHKERLKAISNARSGLAYFKLEEQLQTNIFIQMVKWTDAIEFAGKVIGLSNRH